MTHNYTQHNTYTHTTSVERKKYNQEANTIADSCLNSVRVGVLYFGVNILNCLNRTYGSMHIRTPIQKSGTATGKLFQPRHHSISRVQLRTGKHDRQPIDLMAAITPFH